jgi:thiamine kinase-like enzyme
VIDARGDDAAVADALARVLPGFRPDGGDFRYRVIDGGINKRSFLVSMDDRQYVLQCSVAGTMALLDVASEARVMQAAAAAGLAPRVVGADPATGALLTEYWAGAMPWSGASACEPGNIGRAADLLRALHRVPVALPKLYAARVAARYIAELPDLELDIAKWAEELTRLARDYDERYGADVLCHNDLAAANILDDGKLWLVDFEYAVGGAPILDLASLAGMNDYTAAQYRDLIEAYYPTTVPFTQSVFDDMVRMVRLFALFWALVGERRAADGGAYALFARRMVEALK